MPDETLPPPPTTATPDDAAPPAERLVPVTQAIRYRKRAQAAEQQLAAAQERLDQMRAQLDEAQDAVTALERRQKIDALLADAEAVDLEAARLLTEAAVADMTEPDVAAAVADLRRHKPYLFRRRGSGALTQAARPAAEASDDAQLAAHQAAATGDRRDLLRYLRLRRR